MGVYFVKVTCEHRNDGNNGKMKNFIGNLGGVWLHSLAQCTNYFELGITIIVTLFFIIRLMDYV